MCVPCMFRDASVAFLDHQMIIIQNGNVDNNLGGMISQAEQIALTYMRFQLQSVVICFLEIGYKFTMSASVETVCIFKKTTTRQSLIQPHPLLDIT